MNSLPLFATTLGTLIVSTADFINTIVIVGGGVAAIYFAQQQNKIFKEQNLIFAAQAGIKMPEPPPRNRFGLYWPALIAFLVALGVGIFIARLDLSAPKPVGAVMAAAPWTLAVMLVFSTVYLWKRSKGSEHDIKALQARIDQLRSESVSIAVNGKLVAGPALFEEQRTERSDGLLNPLQIEALKIAKDLRDFLAGLPPFPKQPNANSRRRESRISGAVSPGSHRGTRQMAGKTYARLRQPEVWRANHSANAPGR